MPTSLFALPISFVEDATITTGDVGASAPDTAEDGETLLSSALQRLQASKDTGGTSTATPGSNWSKTGATCMACGIGLGNQGFKSAEEQRAHFKTDWHRYNVKRRLAKQLPVTEEEFETLIQDGNSEVSSISGSSSEESDDNYTGPRTASRNGGGGPAPPRAMFKTQDNQLFCVWKCLLERDHVRGHVDPLTPLQQLKELQRLRSAPGLFVVLLLRGGHVAAAVFKAKAVITASGKQGQPAPGAMAAATGWLQGVAAGPGGGKGQDLFEVVAHKTFHRYVVRAKAGGRQAAKDATGKYARSAGAALRRYNEAALDKDVADLLAAWKVHLDAASLIFVQAPAYNAKSVFGEGGVDDNTGGTSLAAAGAGSAASRGLINPSDPRVRRIPFATQRPTFTEARRVVGLLLSVFEPTAAALAAQQAAAEAAEAGAEQKAQRRAQRKQKKQGGESGVAAVAATEQSGGSREEEDEGMDAATRQLQETPLHAASRQGDAKLVSQLLEEGADPCQRDSRGRVPYAVAADKDTRDTYRRHMARYPEQWDYVAAGVPSALTDELEATQAAKKAEKKARQKARDKERKEGQTEESKAAAAAAAKAAMEEEIARAATEAAALAAKLNSKGGRGAGGGVAGGKQVGAAGRGSNVSGGRGQQQSSAPLTPEEQAKRREMMAAAAEARMKALMQATSQQRLY